MAQAISFSYYFIKDQQLIIEPKNPNEKDQLIAQLRQLQDISIQQDPSNPRRINAKINNNQDSKQIESRLRQIGGNSQQAQSSQSQYAEYGSPRGQQQKDMNPQRPQNPGQNQKQEQPGKTQQRPQQNPNQGPKKDRA